MKNIFDATTIGPMRLKNRLWRSATWMNMADDKGHLTDRLTNVYLKLAEGGVGNIITGYAHIMEEEQPNPGMLGIYSDDFIPEYRAFTEKIHTSGANIVMQICYGGSATSFQPENREIFGPSAVAHPLFNVVPKAMDLADIKNLITAHTQAARRVKASGFDGVQLHAAHSYLLSQFLSPYYNQRKDGYGGSIENRARIIFEILEAVRKEVGPNYPVFIKMHATDDWGDKGLLPEESLYVAKELEQRGITGIEFSGGHLDVKRHTNKGPVRTKILNEKNQSYFADVTAKIAAHLSIPVISVGGHRNPDRLNRLLETTDINYFALSRPLLSEPHLPLEWMNGDKKRPRCVACGKCWAPEGNHCILGKPKASEKH
jgi:2,4-dienoyl-CoA reductase-like NADH-dependent reductase (Old Yellow Enzyme family)